jgi:Uma2 family endonuclease
MAVAQGKVMSFEQLYKQLEALPENQVGEIINGALHANPRPAGPHGRAASVLGMLIGNPFDIGSGGPGGWWIIDEPELHFGEQVLVPDITGWRHETLPQIPQDHRFKVAPDWVCEVLPPSTGKTDRIEKMPIYADMGVQYLWLADPALKTLETYRLVDAQWTLTGSYKDEDTVSAEPFDVIEICLSSLWRAAV